MEFSNFSQKGKSRTQDYGEENVLVEEKAKKH